MVWRMLSTTTWQGLQPARCCAKASQTAGSTVPSTYSFNSANNSSHFMGLVSGKFEPAAGQKLQGFYGNRFSFAGVRRRGQPFCGIAQDAGQVLAQLQPRAEQPHFHVA